MICSLIRALDLLSNRFITGSHARTQLANVRCFILFFIQKQIVDIMEYHIKMIRIAQCCIKQISSNSTIFRKMQQSPAFCIIISKIVAAMKMAQTITVTVSMAHLKSTTQMTHSK